jgi:hypothetical protein
MKHTETQYRCLACSLLSDHGSSRRMESILQSAFEDLSARLEELRLSIVTCEYIVLKVTKCGLADSLIALTMATTPSTHILICWIFYSWVLVGAHESDFGRLHAARKA